MTLSPAAIALLAQLFGDESNMTVKPNAAHLVVEIRAWLAAQEKPKT